MGQHLNRKRNQVIPCLPLLHQTSQTSRVFLQKFLPHPNEQQRGSKTPRKRKGGRSPLLQKKRRKK
ncbi:hypothetical protein H5410_038140 [Solanum commersonii]|uniref:Uncharacterized protein n=1 Tax=Solanum commersonii TaxID=4109 RepID=A0A9J5YC87_SOLCO|nr:hypothetical protein H5410_038140 [Solanum commersonii]